MPVGAKFTESFERGYPKIKNIHIVAISAPLHTLRQELLGSDSLAMRGGFPTADRDHFAKHLLISDRMRRRCTYNPNGKPEDLGLELEKAIDPKGVITAGLSEKGMGDMIPQASGGYFNYPWALDGTDPDIPATSQIKLKSNNGRLIIAGVDRAIEQWVRCESRNQTQWITVEDSLRGYSIYQQIYSFLMQFGGDENRVDIVNPLPSQEPLGVADSANRNPLDAGQVATS